MANEVYGTIELDVSVDVKSEHEELALIEANYDVNELRNFKEVKLLLMDINGDIHTVKVHNWYANWTVFFGKDE